MAKKRPQLRISKQVWLIVGGIGLVAFVFGLAFSINSSFIGARLAPGPSLFPTPIYNCSSQLSDCTENAQSPAMVEQCLIDKMSCDCSEEWAQCNFDCPPGDGQCWLDCDDQLRECQKKIPEPSISPFDTFEFESTILPSP